MGEENLEAGDGNCEGGRMETEPVMHSLTRQPILSHTSYDLPNSPPSDGEIALREVDIELNGVRELARYVKG